MLATWVDQYLAPRGACGICGCDDSRHRITDAIVERVLAGEDVASVASDFGVETAFVERLVREGAGV